MDDLHVAENVPLVDELQHIFFSLASFELPENMSSLLHVSARVTSTTSTRKTHHVTILYAEACAVVRRFVTLTSGNTLAATADTAKAGNVEIFRLPSDQILSWGGKVRLGPSAGCDEIFPFGNSKKVGEIDMHRSCGIDIVRPQGLQQLVYIYISYTTIQYTNYTYIYISVCVHPPKKMPDLTVGSSFLLFPMV